jgi:hypothetical protein
MGDPTDQPAQQAGPDCDQEPGVRLDVGGWISGPCLDPAELEPPADRLTEPRWAWPADERPRPAQ